MLSALVFITLYLFATQQMVVTAEVEGSVQVADNPWSTMLDQTSFIQFEPILRLNGVYLAYFFNPFDTMIALVLAGLTGVNLAISYAAIKQPRACSVSQTRNVLTTLPALLAGSACCAPTLLLILGIQASTALLTVFSYLIPGAIVLLILNIVWAARNVEPDRLH